MVSTHDFQSKSLRAAIFVSLCFRNNTFSRTCFSRKWVEDLERSRSLAFYGRCVSGGLMRDRAGSSGLGCKLVSFSSSVYLCTWNLTLL